MGKNSLLLSNLQDKIDITITTAVLFSIKSLSFKFKKYTKNTKSSQFIPAANSQMNMWKKSFISIGGTKKTTIYYSWIKLYLLSLLWKWQKNLFKKKWWKKLKINEIFWHFLFIEIFETKKNETKWEKNIIMSLLSSPFFKNDENNK